MDQLYLDSMLETAPENLAPEQSVLGAVFLDSNCLDEIDHLEDRDFSLPAHELIIKSMRYLRERDIAVDIMTVTAHLEKRGRLGEVGSVMYLSELAGSVPTASNVKHYADIVRSKAHRRRLIQICPKLVDLTTQDFETDEDFFCAVDEVVSEIRPKTVSKMKSFAETRKAYFDHLRSKVAKILSGFKGYDDWAQLWLGWLYVLAGRPSVGKTAKALQMAYGIASSNPDVGCVLIYSQEMDENEVKDRMVSNIAEVNYVKLINKGGENGFTEREELAIETAYAKVEKLKLYIQDSTGVSIDEIESTKRIMEKEFGKVSAIVIDYLQIMNINRMKNETEAAAIGRVTRRLKNLANKKNRKCVVILLSQLDRAVDNEEPKMKHLKGSGSIEQDADVVEFLYHDGEMDGNVKVIQSIYAKGRNVGLNRFKYRFEWWLQRFVEVTKKAGGSNVSPD